MIYDLQKASMWRRISAFLCDIILFCIIGVGAALLLSTILGVDAYQSKMTDICSQYAGEYNLSDFMTKEELDGAISFEMTQERLDVLPLQSGRILSRPRS